ncbi:MAG: type II secretion system protein [Oceanospirillales bacterium]|nr:type II secretion system protein [Oceanospirillales bacterium]
MKVRGFTLIELVIVLVLIGISAIFSTRFIADMAASYVGTAERGQALAGARFALERLRRELAVAYGPSVYINDEKTCLSFVAALAAGTYQGSVRDKLATFVVPRNLQDEIITNTYMAIRASNDEALWKNYPADELANVNKLKDQAGKVPSLTFGDAFNAADFDREGFGQRFTLLKSEQVRFCMDDKGNLRREVKDGENWNEGEGVLMLSGIAHREVFLDYNKSKQLIRLELVLSTRDGNLVLPGQLQVTYAP